MRWLVKVVESKIMNATLIQSVSNVEQRVPEHATDLAQKLPQDDKEAH